MLSKVRYYFEIISLPFFIILAFHLASSGVSKVMGGEHHHGNESSFFSALFSFENGIAVVLLVFFIWIWHTSYLKKWVPCSHMHCNKEQISAHIIATSALCAHFFPEAELRHALLLQSNINLISIISSFAFVAHFIVDLSVAIFLSLFWQKRWKIGLSLTVISSVWIATTVFASRHESAYFSNTFVLLFSSFLLAMFIHKPHREYLKEKSSCCVKH